MSHDSFDSVMRWVEYRNAKGERENLERMWQYDSPVDFMEDALGQHFLNNEWHVHRHFQAQLKKEPTCNP